MLPAPTDRNLVTALLAALAHGPVELRTAMFDDGTAAEHCPIERCIYIDPDAPRHTQVRHVLAALQALS